MKLVKYKISIDELKDLVNKSFGDLMKAVVDIEKEIMAIDSELHSDEEAYLIDKGSKQTDLWGINLYPEKYLTNEFIEFDSMINLRPSTGNHSRGVDNLEIREKIIKIVKGKII